MATSSVYFPEDLVARLDRQAASKGVSRNQLIVEACRELLREKEDQWPEGFFDPLPKDEARLIKEALVDVEKDRYGTKGSPL